MALSTASWIGIGGAAALIGYVVWKKRTETAAKPTIKPIDTSAPTAPAGEPSPGFGGAMVPPVRPAPVRPVRLPRIPEGAVPGSLSGLPELAVTGVHGMPTHWWYALPRPSASDLGMVPGSHRR